MTDALFDDTPYKLPNAPEPRKPRGEKPLHTIISDGSWWAVFTKAKAVQLAHRGVMVQTNQGRVFETLCGIRGRRLPIAKDTPVNSCPRCLKEK